jgi:hypothetical protein
LAWVKEARRRSLQTCWAYNALNIDPTRRKAEVIQEAVDNRVSVVGSSVRFPEFNTWKLVDAAIPFSSFGEEPITVAVSTPPKKV